MAPTTLLTLPAELRNQIYRHVFTSRHHIDQIIAHPRSLFPPNALSLLLTCHQIHAEAAQLAYTHTTFLTLSHRARSHLARLEDAAHPPSLRSSITSLTLAAHLVPQLQSSRALALYLDGLATVAASLPALRRVEILCEREGSGGTPLRVAQLLCCSSTDPSAAGRGSFHTILASLLHLRPSAQIKPVSVPGKEPAVGAEARPRQRAVYLFRWKPDEGAEERELRIEFLGFWRPARGAEAERAEVEEALAADVSPPAFELRRRERPFLSAGQGDPAERVGRHRRSLGSNASEAGASSPRSEREWGPASPRSSLGSPRISLGSPRNSFGFGSPRSSLGFGSPRSSFGGAEASRRSSSGTGDVD